MTDEQIRQGHFPLPYFTTHTPLALALEQAGCPLLGVWNLYTAEGLAKAGARTVAEAHARGIPGQVSYFFDRTPELMALVEAWNDQTARIKAGESVNLSRPDPEDVVRIIASAFIARKVFADLWKEAVPKLQEQNGGDVRTTFDSEGNKVQTHPGFRIVSANASATTRDHLRL